MNPLPDMIVLDFETSGHRTADNKNLDIPSQLPTEVVAIRVVGGEVTSVFNTLVFYNADDYGWTDYLAGPNNHHTKEELLKGMREQAVAEILLQMIYGGEWPDPVVVAYNALFDLEVLFHMLERLGGGAGKDFAYNINFIDPLTIARDRHPYPHKLGDMCKVYGIELEDAHVALDDGMALVELVKAMHEEKDITSYVNVAGYKRQYGEPLWKPDSAVLVPQGNEQYYNGEKTTKKPAPFGGAGAKKPSVRLVPKRN